MLLEKTRQFILNLTLFSYGNKIMHSHVTIILKKFDKINYYVNVEKPMRHSIRSSHSSWFCIVITLHILIL